MDECGFHWTTGNGPEDPNDTGIHTCLKPTRHIHDITDDEHQCCCGANTWNNDV